MVRYRYLPLDEKKNEIRLVVILPGRFQDPVRVSILHESLNIPDESATENISIEELRKALPPDWEAFETLEGRTIYGHVTQDGVYHTTWDHPIPEFKTSGVRYRDSITSKLKYEALSYVWGSSEDQVTVEVVQSASPDMKIGTLSSLSSTALEVSRDLYNTMRRLRTVEDPRAMWIDAICINQADLSERSREVRRMRDIYRLAFRVVMYLGPGSSNSGLALSTLSYLGQQVETSKTSFVLPAPERRETDWWFSAPHIPRYDRRRQAIMDLIMRPFFQRLWIIQEMQLANHRAVVQAGDAQVPWYYVRRGLERSWQISYDGHGPYPLTNVAHQVYQRFTYVTNISMKLASAALEDFFVVTMRSECSDLRDKIYGFLGLLPIRMARRTQPRYSATIPEVYKEAFLAILEYARRLDLLAFAAPNDKGNINPLPSWVPDFSSKLLTAMFGVYRTHASGDSAAHFKYVSPDTLEVTGVDYTSVELVSETLSSDLQHIAASAKRCWAFTDDGYPTGEPLDEVMTRTLVLNKIGSSWPNYQKFPTLEEVTDIFERFYNGGGVQREWTGWIDLTRGKLDGMKLFKTPEGLIGIGHGDVQPEDRVVVLLGCYFPVIIRRVSARHYRIVSRCYVHGIMNGEALLGPIPNPWTVQYVLKEFGNQRILQARYLNTATDFVSYEDPRLGEMPEDWVRDWTQRDDMRHPYEIRFHKNKVTGECINSDPRLLPAALRERGVQLQDFRLV